MLIKGNKSKAINSSYILKPAITSIISFLVLVVIGYFIIDQQQQLLQEKERLEMQGMLEVTKQNVQQIIQNSYTVAASLSLIIDDNGNYQNFETSAERLLKNNQNISAVQLVPNGIIKDTYPNQGNEASIGLNLFETEHTKDEAFRAIELREMYFAGPLELVQGGTAIVGRLPIYRNQKFWGFSAVIINLDTLIEESGLQNFNNKRYYLSLSKINPVTFKEDFFLKRENNFEKAFKKTLQIPQGDWNIQIVKKRANNDYLSLYPTIILWTVFCIISSVFLYFLLKKPSELEKVIKDQTAIIAENEREFQAIFDHAGLGIAVININTRKFEKANSHLCSILGCSLEDLKNESIHKFRHPEDNFNFENLLSELKNGDINVFTVTRRLKSVQGLELWINITVSPMWDKDEEPNYYVAIIEDITEKKKSYEQLKQSESRFKSLFDDSPIPLREEDLSEVQNELKRLNICHLPSTKIYRYFKTHPEELRNCISKIKIINVNKETLRLRNATNKEVLIKNFTDIISKNNTSILIKQLITICKGRTFFSGETNIVTINGEHKDVQVKWYVVPGYEGNYKRVFVSTEEITAQKNAIRELRNSHKILLERNKRLLDFSYITSHNLRSHTSNIQTIITTLDFIDDLTERKGLFAMLKVVADSLDETIHNLNEVTSIRANINIKKEKLNLLSYIKKCLDILSDKIKSEDIRIINHINSEEFITFSTAYLESILLNLVSNAIKYRDPEKDSYVEISLKNYKEYQILYVKDNGIGIDLKKHGDKIFGMYKTFSEHPEAKGIGLFIIKNQIEAMGGKIEVDSKPGEGSTFKVYIQK
ncbi:hypothetical protein SAMN05216480_11137 [Pustulibacterium marinum]|uniref:histidine kinase n=1 Tax=Pustulibacterium marinum TaxID=1224947 RepID=A0A1I7HUK0_9FLAO|nr:PAS domain S-box protein [Pustulibacterium marinum]SFU64412.1 hypothetical protein SAMN05216480_11137 [Pustulibacterium marinum]